MTLINQVAAFLRERDSAAEFVGHKKARKGWDTVAANKKKDNNVCIAAYADPKTKPVHRDGPAFEARIRQLPCRPFTAHTGKDFLDRLAEASERGPIKTFVVSSHSLGGIMMNNDAGLYPANGVPGNPGKGFATLDDLKKRIDSGDIKFAEDAVIILTGCRTGYDYIAGSAGPKSFAAQLSNIVPGATVVGATGFSAPTPKNRREDSNNYVVDSGGWYAYRYGEPIIDLGKTMNPVSINLG
jgi:hypothetical protein